MYRKIGIWGHYHGKNLGDDIVVATIIQNLRERLPEADFVGFSLDPEDTCIRHGIPAYSIIAGMKSPVLPSEIASKSPDGEMKNTGTSDRGADRQILALGDGQGLGEPAYPQPDHPPRDRPVPDSPMRQLRQWVANADNGILSWLNTRISKSLSERRMRQSLENVDVLIVAGSGPFYDAWDGSGIHPANLNRWSECARAARTLFVPLSVGAGPVYEPMTRTYLRQTLERSHYKSFRDPYSVEVVKEIGTPRPYPIFPDSAFGLSPSVVDQAKQAAVETPGGIVVGLGTMAHEDPRYMPRGEKEKYVSYRKKLTELAAWVIEQDMTPLLLRNDRADDRVAEEIVDGIAELGYDRDQVLMLPTETHEDLLAQMAACDVVVSGRFHGQILPLVLGIPVLGLAYHQKNLDMMAYMGQSEHCVDIDDSDLRDITQRLLTLIERREEISSQIQPRAEACREALQEQYDALVDGTTDTLRGSYLPQHGAVLN